MLWHTTRFLLQALWVFGVKSWFVRLWFKTLALIPLSILRSLGAALGSLLWLLKDRSSKTTLINLQTCFPKKSEAERRELAQASLKHTGMLALELGPVWCKDLSWLNSKLERVEDEQLFTDAQAKGKGVLVMSPHIGNWEVIGRVLGRYGELTSLYQPPKQSYLEPIIHSARQQDGASLVPTNARGVAALLKALKRGCISGILPDQVPDKKGGKYAPFFGYPALTMTLIHGLVQRTGCAVVFGITLRTRKGWILKFIEAEAAIYSENEDEALAALNRGVERCIEAAPEQYQWEYKRFRREPEGYPKLYG